MTMKRRRQNNEDDEGGGRNMAKKTKHVVNSSNNNNTSDAQMTELLKNCLLKVCELQAELAQESDNTSDDDEDAEAAGYAACAVETLRFLAAEGLSPEHPIVRSLSQRLLRHENNEP